MFSRTAALGKRFYTIWFIGLCLFVPAGIQGLAASKQKLNTATVIAKSLGAVALKREGARIPLELVRKNQPLSDRIGKRAAGKSFYLVLKNIRSLKQPDAVYQVYLNLEEGKKPTDETPVGVLNFYNFGGSWEGKTRTDVFFSFDVTEAMNKLRSDKRLSEPLTVTMIPGESPAEDAAATIGQIELVEQ